APRGADAGAGVDAGAGTGAGNPWLEPGETLEAANERAARGRKKNGGAVRTDMWGLPIRGIGRYDDGSEEDNGGRNGRRGRKERYDAPSGAREGRAEGRGSANDQVFAETGVPAIGGEGRRKRKAGGEIFAVDMNRSSGSGKAKKRNGGKKKAKNGAMSAFVRKKRK
ncbi:hypothetical protein ACFSW5_17615, partial [Paenibacillus thailandensis]